MTFHWQIATGAAAVILTLALLWQGALSARDRARRDEVAARAQAAATAAELAVEGATASATRKALARELTVTVKAREAADEIEQAPGAETRLPAELVERWAAAIDRLRDTSDFGGTDHQARPDGPAGRLP
jgi:hypothetical protein